MIVIDMDMPECWDDCRFNNGCECCLIDAVCTDETAGENGELPSFCPIKCDIEDIKTEIADYTLSDDEKTDMDEDSIKWGIKIAYDIINKHTKGDTDADNN